jgi:putative DNA primase/helicase
MIPDKSELEKIDSRELDDITELVHQKNYPGSAPLPRKTKPGAEAIRFYRSGPNSKLPTAKKAEDEIIIARRNAGNIAIKKIRYVTPIAPGHMATALTGYPGEGKTLIAVDQTARVSKGAAFPFFGKPGEVVQGRVFYISSEGVPEMILVPRLVAAGADLSKVDIIEGVYNKDGEFGILDITQHLPGLEAEGRKCPELKLIVIDPVASFLPERVNTNQQNQVRRAMDLLSNLAYKLGVAVVVVMHFAKAPGNGKAINQTSGSAQFMAGVKMSWSVIRRPEDPRNVRLLVPQKSNISGDSKSLSFVIQPATFKAPNGEIIETAKIEYLNLIDEDPNTLICPPQENNELKAACDFLRKRVQAGDVVFAQDIIKEAADEMGLPSWTMKKARVKIGLDSDKENTFQGRTFWYWPKAKL